MCVCVCVCVFVKLHSSFFPSVLMYFCVHTSGKQHWARKICRQEAECLLNTFWTNTNTLFWSDRIVSDIHAESLLSAHYTEITHKLTKRCKLKYTEVAWWIWKQHIVESSTAASGYLTVLKGVDRHLNAKNSDFGPICSLGQLHKVFFLTIKKKTISLTLHKKNLWSSFTN